MERGQIRKKRKLKKGGERIWEKSKNSLLEKGRSGRNHYYNRNIFLNQVGDGKLERHGSCSTWGEKMNVQK